MSDDEDDGLPPLPKQTHGDSCPCEACEHWRAKKSLESFVSTRTQVQDVLRRVLHEAGRGQPLSQETIDAVRWAAEQKY